MIYNVILRCKPFDSYPRTYDLLHAAGLFSVERKRYNSLSLVYIILSANYYRICWHKANEYSKLYFTNPRCNISTIMLEMDRLLRPGGRVYIRDTMSIMGELQTIASALGWVPALHDTGEGPHSSWKILMGDKRLWHAWWYKGLVSTVYCLPCSHCKLIADCQIYCQGKWATNLFSFFFL